MSRIKSRDTKPELTLRKLLWSKGCRYRVKNNLPGKPDIIFTKSKVAVFVDGCFWHKCPKHFNQPKSNREFWLIKINENVRRDQKNTTTLEKSGWQVIRVWEHEIKDEVEAVAVKIISTL
ncbi:MAG: very short patch repair endonuclease [Candidatus Thiodiazotropha lotti]|nr:very short patch repair endonuclease [Candidatus Thiodiazotropha lotti]